MEKRFTTLQKLGYILAGALLTGAMWRIRGTNGWGSEWGVFTVGMLFMLYVYTVFRRKTNASFLQVTTASVAAMLTVPAWGTLLHQTSGFFEVSFSSGSEAVNALFDKYETTACTPLSGVFIMLCLGFGMMPLYLVLLSRTFSDKPYSIGKYVTVFAVFFGVYYLCNATVSHAILKLIQPESLDALKRGFEARGMDGSVYSLYMKHFSDIQWGKKTPYGRNYFTEISVISRAIAACVTAIAVRFGLKDKAGGNIMFWGCAAFSVGTTLANVFFVLNTKYGHSVVPDAWSFWEFFTGFFAGLFLMILLFILDKKIPDAGFTDVVIPKVPEKVADIFQCVMVIGVCFGMTLIRPVVVRLDQSRVLTTVIYAVGGVIVAFFAVLMLLGKIPKVWRKNPAENGAKLVAVLFAIHSAVYLFVGSEARPPAAMDHRPVQYMMYCVIPVALLLFVIMRKEEFFPKKLQK